MIARYYFSIFLIIFLLLPLAAQKATETSMIDEIRRESFDLAVIEEEIEYYKELLKKKDQVKRLFEQNRLSTIRELFERDLAELDALFDVEDTERIVDKIWELEHIYSGIENLDLKNYFPEQKMQYFEARLAVRNGNYRQARTILEDILTNDLDPQRRNSVVALLEEVYFNLERYEDIISVYPIYRGINSARQRWWLGQALYNTNDLEKAEPVFRRLSNDTEYGLRSEAMLALITYQRGNMQKAITDFNSMKYRYSPDTPYYNFINLSLARLYSLNGNYEQSVNLYDQYVQLEEEISDDILYEIALLYKDAKEYQQALKYFRQITEKDKKSKYYVSANYLIAITEQDRGNYERGRENLRRIIERNNDLMEALNKKYGLLENYAEKLRELMNPSLSSAQQQEIDTQLKLLEEQFRNNREEIERLSLGLESNSQQYLSLLEAEYFAYTITLTDFEAFIKFTRNPMQKRIATISNYQMSRQDSSIVYLQIVDYMKDLPQKSTFQYEKARFLAEQKVYQAFLRNNWYDIYQLSQKYNKPEVTSIADNADSLVSINLSLITDLENITFKKELSNSDKDVINEKIDKIQNNNKKLKEKEEDYITAFSEKITPELSVELEEFSADQNTIRLKYIDTITEMLENLSSENNMYQNTLLDILFRQTMLLDQEYSEYRETITNE